MKTIPYIGIILLLFVILLQNRSCKPPEAITKIDTLIVYDTIRDTIPGKPIYISSKIDTSIWMKKEENKPDTTYKGLLNQYKSLGNRHFSTNVFQTRFKIADYGDIIVTDSIKENSLLNSNIITNLTIPTTTITIEKEASQKNQLYIGGELSTGKTPIYGGFLFKNKKNNIYGFSVGYEIDNKLVYKGSIYIPLKIK